MLCVVMLSVVMMTVVVLNVVMPNVIAPFKYRPKACIKKRFTVVINIVIFKGSVIDKAG